MEKVVEETLNENIADDVDPLLWKASSEAAEVLSTDLQLYLWTEAAT